MTGGTWWATTCSDGMMTVFDWAALNLETMQPVDKGPATNSQGVQVGTFKLECTSDRTGKFAEQEGSTAAIEMTRMVGV